MNNNNGCLYLFLRFLKPFFHGFDKKEIELPYHKQEFLMTKSETEFYRVLCQACENDYLIFAQINLNNLLGISNNFEPDFYWKWRSKIDRKSVDYVLCDPDDLSIILAIELDDKTHQKKNRIERDQFVNKAFETAGAKLLRIKAKQKYNADEIRILIDSKLNR